MLLLIIILSFPSGVVHFLLSFWNLESSFSNCTHQHPQALLKEM